MGTPNRGRWRDYWARSTVRAVRVALALAAVWFALTLRPQPLFAYSLQKDNVVLFAREPLPKEAGTILEDAVRRVARSPLYDAHEPKRVFLCDSAGLYDFLTLAAKGRGRTNVFGNVFIRPANVATNRVPSRFGELSTGERTLAYFIAHELTHAMVLDRFGPRFLRLSAFQNEGYADYVGMARPVDLVAGRAAIERDAPEMDPQRSGLYRRYELLVAYLLQKRGLTVDQLLAKRMAQGAIERELASDPALESRSSL